MHQNTPPHTTLVSLCLDCGHRETALRALRSQHLGCAKCGSPDVVTAATTTASLRAS